LPSVESIPEFDSSKLQVPSYRFRVVGSGC
jgi:hypothetical protein